LGALSNTGLIAEIKKLYDQAYQLGLQESKEMTHGKYLNVFVNSSASGSRKKQKH
jgi:protein lin-52